MTRAQLLDGAFQVRVRASRGRTNTAFTAYLDAVSVRVEYRIPRTRQYDANGATTSDGVNTYAHDALGRLTSVSGPGISAAYTLDGDGNRVAATVNGTTTSFDLDVRGLPTVLAESGRLYLPGQPEAGYSENGVWWNSLTTAQGSVLQRVSESGTTSATYRYDPYGGARPGSTRAPLIGYAGEWADATETINLRARAYDPSIGRFLSRDSFAGFLAEPVSGNRYLYAHANPLRYTDPSGHLVRAARYVMSEGLQFFCDACSALIAALGYDPIADIHLSPEARFAYAAAATIPFATGAAVHIGMRILEPGSRALVRAATHGDGFLDVARGASRVGDDVPVGGLAEEASLVGIPAAATRTADDAAARIDEAFHYTYQTRRPSIERSGLRRRTFATPDGGLSPLQAHIDLGLSPNRGLPDMLVRIDVAGLRAAGYEIPAVTRVTTVVVQPCRLDAQCAGRMYPVIGGGYQMLFPYRIPAKYVAVDR